MANDHFDFKQFSIQQALCSQKVSTDACIFGAWLAKYAVPARTILDIGAGTGLLMMMLAQKQSAQLTGIEIDSDCYAQLTSNLQGSRWTDRMEAVHGDVRQYVPGRTFDLVISNPPFYEKQLLSPDQKKNLAWHGSGLKLAELFDRSVALMGREGQMGLLLPFARAEEAMALANSLGLKTSRSLTVRHTRNHPFTRIIFLFSRDVVVTGDEVLEIRNEDGTYTEAFSALLRDYYLFL